jgi:MAF protein
MAILGKVSDKIFRRTRLPGVQIMMSDSTTHSMPGSGPFKLVLGSTSPFRRQLLERLGVAFETASPEVDESCLPREHPQDLVRRLALAKAQAVAATHPHSLVIGSDQVACVDGSILGKPGTHQRARCQLQRASGKRVSFFTGLCLLNTDSAKFQLVCEPFHVYFRQLRPEQIERYLSREKPYNCAGSFKSEGLGIALFERMEGDDPNALVGLPLIRLISMLAVEGIEIP